ncbi:glycosyl hydrolase [Coraliomargarita sp. W4R53]
MRFNALLSCLSIAVITLGCIWHSDLQASQVRVWDFSEPQAPLLDQGEFVGREASIYTSGTGLAGLFKAGDGFAKLNLGEFSQAASGIRISTSCVLSPLPNSSAGLFSTPDSRPAWISLGVTPNSNSDRGLIDAAFSVTISSSQQKTLLGVGRSVGSNPPQFFEEEIAGALDVADLVFEYAFADERVKVSLNGEVVFDNQVSLKRTDFANLVFQVRRMQPVTHQSPGGIDALKIEWLNPTSAQHKTALRAAPKEPNADFIWMQQLEQQIAKASSPTALLAALKSGWANPPSTYRPHTRWWWPGNAVTNEGITWQLEEMKDKGFGGVEIMSFLKIYEKGNIDFDSPEFIEKVTYTVNECRRLGMYVSLSLGPGWNHGNSKLPQNSRAKALEHSEFSTNGGAVQAVLPMPKSSGGQKRLESVVAIALDAAGNEDTTQIIDLNEFVTAAKDWGKHSEVELSTDLPEGRWKIISFWLVYTNQRNVAENFEARTWAVDHLKPEAMDEYLGYMGGKYLDAFGDDFGQTVDSFFGDSFELDQGFSYWTDGLLQQFEQEKGYDLRPYLPMLVYDGAPETPYVRYDVGHFLHQLGIAGTMQPLADYSEEAGIDMRQQPHYRFTTDIIEASGVLQRPETENTKHSFDPIIWHKLTTSGAWLYPSKKPKFVSAEAFTFTNWKYRTSMEEIKRGTDLFIRDGITQFYNHGYFYTPEKDIAPSRDLLWMNRISHVNTWWPWYRGLADYQARAAFLSRQGRADSDVLLYSTMSTLWSERAEFPVKHVRDLALGHLPKTLIANGYDFDCVNDDLLLNHTEVVNGKLRINGYEYSVLLLPRALYMSPEALEVIELFLRSGGTVFSLQELPHSSLGLMGQVDNDRKVREIIEQIFNVSGGMKEVGKGHSYFLPNADGLSYLEEWLPSTRDPVLTPPLSAGYQEFFKYLRQELTPDVELGDKTQSDGLTFRRTRIGELECWFICNLQPVARKVDMTLNSQLEYAYTWDAMDGSIEALQGLRHTADGRVIIPVDLEAWESQFVLLSPQEDSSVPLLEVAEMTTYQTHKIEGEWSVHFKEIGGNEQSLTMSDLTDWTDINGFRDFAGTAEYSLEFELLEIGETTLDLGQVNNVASVWVNGELVGKLWMQPYRLNITKYLKSGQNNLKILVANRLWNHTAGLTAPKPIPANLHKHYSANWNKKYNGWNSTQNQKHVVNNDRLPSGLIGPVLLKVQQ